MLQTKALTEVIREWSGVFMRRSGRDFRGFMEETGLSFSHINILMRLFHSGKCSVSAIGERMGITNPAASQSIDQLVKLGLIERTEDPHDRRAKQLALSQAGQALVEKAIEVRSQWVERITDALTPEQQSMIISALTLLTEAALKIED